MERQQRLFSSENLPRGFIYEPGFISADEERALVEAIGNVELSHFEMHGGVAKRRIAHYGVSYQYNARSGETGPPVPEFLLGVRARLAARAGLEPEAFAEALITEYAAGAGIGWHRDARIFGDVIAGISLLSACLMKFRPYVSPKDLGGPGVRAPRRTTHEVELEPRSAYLITGVARREFEHSILSTHALRYSITFRTLR